MNWSILFLIFFLSCSSELKYGAGELFAMGKKIEPNIELIGISSSEQDKRVLCENYGYGCVTGSGRRVLVRKVELVVVEFSNEQAAREEAIRIDQYYARNWVFDEVTNEPVLEDFVKKAFGAKRPRPEVDQKPKDE